MDIPPARRPHTRVEQLQAEAALSAAGSAGHSDSTIGSRASSIDDRVAILHPLSHHPPPPSALISQPPVPLALSARPPVVVAHPDPNTYVTHPSNPPPHHRARSSANVPAETPNDFSLSTRPPDAPVIFEKIHVRQSQKYEIRATDTYRPVTREHSFLECVAELLKGAYVHRKKNVLQGTEARIWLRPDMEVLECRLMKKSTVPRTIQIRLSKVRKVKGTDKDLHLDLVDEKKPIEFVFCTAKELNIWLSALCCLVPKQAVVKKHHKRIENRWDYNPMQDTWNDKRVCQRKMFRELMVLGTIGTGATAKVKATLSSTERRFYAVKVISKATLWKTRRMGGRFGRGMLGRAGDLTMYDLEEPRVLMNLRHENVIRLYAVFEDEDLEAFYYVTEYLPSGPVMKSHTVQTERRLDEDRARSAFVDVLAGLEYLHRNNVVHRDIKPDNLLSSGDGTVKITDFGAAIKYEDPGEGEESQKRRSGNENMNMGTPAFTAPELCISDNAPACPERCFAADIWSLGATLFYFLFGRPPHMEKNVLNMYDVICTEPVVFPAESRISASLENMIRRMLEKKPEDRATIREIAKSSWLDKDVFISEKVAKLRGRLQEGVQDLV